MAALDREHVGGFSISRIRGDVVLHAQGDIVAGNKTVIQQIQQVIVRHLTAAPYKFLSYYDIPDSDIFFGRDRAISHLQEIVARHKAVVVSGPSGAGKSSLVNAGLIPILANQGYSYVRFRDYTDPLRQLRRSLSGMVGKDTQDMSLTEIARSARQIGGGPVVVVLDQFERFVLSVTDSDKALLFNELGEFINGPATASDMSIMVVVREEFLGRALDELDRSIHDFATESPSVFVRPLTTAEAAEAIKRPLEKIAAKIYYVDRFVEDILIPDLVRQSPGDEAIEPAHLQIVCNRLYEDAAGRVTRGATGQPIDLTLYKDLGRSKLILHNYLEETVKRASGGVPLRTAAIKSLLKSMVESNGTRRFLAISDIEAIFPRSSTIPETELHRILRDLQDERVLEPRLRESDGQTVYSLSHEVLVPRVLEWHDESDIFRKRAEETLASVLGEYSRTNTLLNEAQLALIRQWIQRPLRGAETELLSSSATQVDERRQRERRARRRDRWIRNVGISAIVVLAFLAFAVVSARAASARSRADKLHQAGLTALANHQVLEAEVLLAEALVVHDSWTARMTLADRPSDSLIREQLLRARAQGVRALPRRDPGGRVLALSVDGALAALSRNNEFCVVRTADGVTLFTAASQPGYPVAAAFSDDGSQVAYAFGSNAGLRNQGPVWHLETDGVPRVVDLSTTRGSPIDITMVGAGLKMTKQVSAIAFDHHNRAHRRIAVGSEDGIVQVWSIDPATFVAATKRHPLPIRGVAFHYVDDLIATASSDASIGLWRFLAPPTTVYASLKGHEDVVMSVAFDPTDSTLLASGSADGTAKLWDYSLGHVKQTLTGHFGMVLSIAFGVDGATLATGCEDEYLRVFELSSGSEILRLRSLAGPVQAVAFQRDALIAGGGRQSKSGQKVSTGWLRTWNIGHAPEMKTFYNGPNKLTTVIAGKQFLLSADSSGGVTFRRYSGEIEARHEAVKGFGINALELSADSNWLALGSTGSGIEVWNVADLADIRKLVVQPNGHMDGEVWSLSFDRLGKRLAFGSDAWLQICEMGNAQLVCDPVDAGGKIWSTSFSPSGKAILTAGNDSSVHLWDSTTKKELHHFSGHSGEVYAAVFSPNGRIVASGSVDRRVFILSADRLNPIREPFVGHQGAIMSLAFLDDDHLVSASLDHTVRLWRVGDGSSTDLGIDDRPVWWVAARPDGRYLASASLNGNIRLWAIDAIDRCLAMSPSSLQMEAGAHSQMEIRQEEVVERRLPLRE